MLFDWTALDTAATSLLTWYDKKLKRKGSNALKHHHFIAILQSEVTNAGLPLVILFLNLSLLQYHIRMINIRIR